MEISGKDRFTLFACENDRKKHEHDVSHTSQDEGKHVFKFFRHKVELNCLQLP